MNDFERIDPENGTAAPQTPTEEQPAPYTEPDPASAPTVQLTLDPEPVTPPVPEAPQAPKASAPVQEQFHMPEPPHAPQPPQPQPVYQQAPPQNENPNWGNQNPYGAPSYQQPVQYNQPMAQKPLYNTPPAGYTQKSRLAAGLLALILGSLGIHNYYLGFNTRATIQLVVSLVGGILTCGLATAGIAIWGFVEGILILSGSGAHMYDGNGVILRD